MAAAVVFFFGQENKLKGNPPLGCMGMNVTAAKCCASLIKSKQRAFHLVIVVFLLVLFEKDSLIFLFLS